jgi:hypothetical protein
MRRTSRDPHTPFDEWESNLACPPDDDNAMTEELLPAHNGEFDAPPSGSNSNDQHSEEEKVEEDDETEKLGISNRDRRKMAFGVFGAAAMAAIAVSAKLLTSDDPDIPDDPAAVFRGDEVGYADGGGGTVKAAGGGDFGGGAVVPTGQESAIVASAPPPPVDPFAAAAIAPPDPGLAMAAIAPPPIDPSS